MANSVSETEGDIDWEVVRSGLNKRIRLHLDRVDPHEREDLVQEAFVGVLRQARRGPIRNLEGLLTTVAHGVCTDFVRRRTRWRSVLEPLADHTMQHSVGPTMECSELGDPRERAIFLASEFFAGRAKCQQIWEAKVQKKSLATLANELRVSDTAIRQRWTDCLKRLRSALAEGGVIPTFLGVFHELN